MTPPERPARRPANSDAHWNIAANPMTANCPRTLPTTATFDEDGGRTRTRPTWVRHEASEAEIAGFDAAMDSMVKGWKADPKLLWVLLTERRA